MENNNLTADLNEIALVLLGIDLNGSGDEDGDDFKWVSVKDLRLALTTAYLKNKLMDSI